ncbi:hypothetical protein LCGC14_2990060, partial [marine sediment metagenome]
YYQIQVIKTKINNITERKINHFLKKSCPEL